MAGVVVEKLREAGLLAAVSDTSPSEHVCTCQGEYLSALDLVDGCSRGRIKPFAEMTDDEVHEAVAPAPSEHECEWDSEGTPPRRTCGCDERPTPSEGERVNDLASEIERHKPVTVCECDGVHEDGGCRESRSVCDFCCEQWPCLVDKLACRLTPPAPSDGEREARVHRPETTLAYVETECAVMDCEHETECPMREVMICAECLRVAEGAHPGWAESRFDLTLVSWPCSTGAPPAPVDRKPSEEQVKRGARAFYAATWLQRDAGIGDNRSNAEMVEDGVRAALSAALAVSPAPARDEWEAMKQETPTKIEMTDPVWVMRGGAYLLDEHAGVLIDSAGNFSAKTKGDPRSLAVLLRSIAESVEESLPVTEEER